MTTTPPPAEFDITVVVEGPDGQLIETAKFTSLTNAARYAVWLSTQGRRVGIMADDASFAPRLYVDGERVNA